MKERNNNQKHLTSINSTLVFDLDRAAKRKQAEGQKVINATVGALAINNKLVTFKAVNNAKKEIENKDFNYAPVDGGEEFNTNAQKWVFKDLYKSIRKKYFVSSFASLGGTGGIFLSMFNYAKGNQHILVPSLGWSNYDAIANQNGFDVKKYNIFKENKFDINDLKNKCLEEINISDRLTLVINDPCHNPTGYSLNEDEWLNIISFLNELSIEHAVTLILDVAYLDFYDKSRLFFELIDKNEMLFMTLVAFSASKTLGLYGLRVGDLIAINMSKEEIDEFDISMKNTVRAVYSNPNIYGINLFNAVMSNGSNYQLLLDELEYFKLELEKRKNWALKYFSFIKGRVLPYAGGFFLTYEVENANQYAEELTKQNIYVLPIDNKYLRIALCSIEID